MTAAARSGFTLIELLFVILVIGILIAVAAPSFLGVTNQAHDSPTKQALSSAFQSAEVVRASSGGVFPSAARLARDIAAAEPELGIRVVASCRKAAAIRSKHQLIVAVSTESGPGLLVLYAPAASGAIFRLTAVNNGPNFSIPCRWATPRAAEKQLARQSDPGSGMSVSAAVQLGAGIVAILSFIGVVCGWARKRRPHRRNPVARPPVSETTPVIAAPRAPVEAPDAAEDAG